MPFKDANMTNQPKLQFFASTFSIDGFFDAIIKTDPLEGWFNSTDITASTVNIAFPGISKKYGKDRPVKIQYKTKKIEGSTVTAKNSIMGAYITLILNIWVNKSDSTDELALSITLKDTAFSFNVDITDMVANMVIDTLNVDNIVQNSCTFGNLSTKIMKLKINNAWRWEKSAVNKELAKHSIALPSKPTEYFEITDVALSYYNNFIGIGVTPIFSGPTT